MQTEGGTILRLPQWRELTDIGLYMDQVIVLTQRTFSSWLPEGEITKSMVNNYVKHGLLARPEGKKYTREHLAVLLEIAVLKQAMGMENVRVLLKVLARDGVQAGYERFCAQFHAMQEALERGELSVDMMEMSGKEQALCLGVAAAVGMIALKERLNAQE